MGFTVDRQIIAGNTLLAEAIQSQNYATGFAGWTINADGSVEFNGGTFRGAVVVGGAANVSINSAPAALVAFYAFLASVSQVSITMAAGDGSYHYEIVGIAGGGNLYYGSGIVDKLGNVVEVFNQGLSVGGDPITSFGRGSAALTVTSGFAGGGSPVIYAGAPLEIADALYIDGGTVYQIDGKRAPRNTILDDVIAVGATAASATEQAVYTSGNLTFKAGGAFEVWIVMQLNSSVAQAPLYRLRKGTVAGTNLLSGAAVSLPAGTPPNTQAIRIGVIVNSTAADVVTPVVVTVQPSIATAVNIAGTGSAESYLRIVDCGDATDYPTRISV